jgi:hypothetical protein
VRLKGRTLVPVSTGQSSLTLADLEGRLRILLPANYRETYDDVQPTPMRSAGLKFAPDGTVAWNEIWQSFCDLAMAGGPPHKGALLTPGSRADVEAEPTRYHDVVSEICRGIELVTQLPADPAPDTGWVRVECLSDVMAAWLLRAIAIENVAVWASGVWLHLPASPAFRLEKETKNVITVIAKTSHYWLEHMPLVQQRAMGELFSGLDRESPLVEPARRDESRSQERPDPAHEALAAAIGREAGLRTFTQHYDGWLGVECPGVRAAVWMVRALVAMNVLARREGMALYVPVNHASDPGGASVSAAVARARDLAAARGVW